MAFWKFFLDNIEVEEPIGWDGIEFTAKRMESHGIDQPFSTEITFYDKGARILKNYYDAQFINAEIPIKIIGDVNVNGQPYEFNGFVNMSIYSERNVCDTDTWQISVGIIDDNFREKFKSRMDVELDIYSAKDLDGNAIPEPTFDDTRLHTQEVYLVGYAKNLVEYDPADPVASIWAYIFWTNYDGWNYTDFIANVPAYFSNSDFKGPFGSTFDPVSNKFSTTNVIFKNNSTFTRTITFNINLVGEFGWTLNGMPGDTANIDLYISLWNGSTYISWVKIGETGLNTYGDPSNRTAFDLSGSVDYVIPPDYTIIYQLRWGMDGNINPGMTPSADIGRELLIIIKNCCVTLTEKNKGEYASSAKTLLAETFLRRVVHIMTGDSNGLISDTFSKNNDGCYWNYALTNGLKIRNAVTAEGSAAICDPLAAFDETNFMVTFKRLFDGLNSIFCLGWAFELVNSQWKVRIETLDYFYQNNINFTAIHVDEVIQSAQTDKLANQFKIGYDDTWKNIQTAGLWAIHTDRNYYVNNRAMSEGGTKKIELLSNIIAEGYAIEFSRRLYFFQDDSGSSDRPNDYELFIIWLNRNELVVEDVEDSEYKLPQESGTITFAPGSVSMSSRRITQSNSEVGDLYNINITPHRNALRWWKMLGMHTFGLATPRMQYQTGQYQTQYSSLISESLEPCQESTSGLVIYENADIIPNNLKVAKREYLFKPIEIEFKYPQSLCDFLILADQQPYGKVRLESGSLIVSGYITNIANQPEDNSGGTTSFKLLASNIADPEPTGERAYSSAYSNAYL